MKTVTDLSRLSLPERALIKAAEQAHEADLRTDGGLRSMIRAEVLRDLCTGARADWKVTECIRMTAGQVVGHLDLSGAHLAYPLCFTDCVFEDTVDLRHSRAEHPVKWVGGTTAAIFADGFESETDLTFHGVTIIGTVSLHWANVRGDLRMSSSTLAPSSGTAINGADVRVGGTLFLDGEDFHATGEVCLKSAHIEGQLDCRHARFSNPSGYSINAAHLVLDGELLCEQGFRSEGEVCLKWAQVKRVRATGGTFASSTPCALHLDALRATGGIYLDRGFRATATVRLVGADITGELCCTQGTFDNPSNRALDAERVAVDDVYLDRGFSAHGEVRFAGAQIRRQLNATNGEFRNEQANEYALDADGLNCGGQVFLNQGFHATGAVSLTGAAIHGELNCTGGSFTNMDGYALFADGLTTPGMVYLDGKFRALGEVRFARATVGRQLTCTSGVFNNQHGVALDLTGLISPGDVHLNGGFRATGRVRMRNADISRDLDFSDAQLHGGEGLDARGLRVGGCLTWKMDPAPEGTVDLSFARISRLDDTAESWPEKKYMLAGTTYLITDGRVTVEQRIKWLQQTTVYYAHAYHQLADAYRVNGMEQSSEQVAIASQRDQRKRGGLRRHSIVWNLFLDRAVGYGYRLHRPFLALLFLGLIGGVVYLWGERAGLIYATNRNSAFVAPHCTPGYPCFNSFVYSFQLLIPGLDLREGAYWLPNASTAAGKALMVYTWIMIVLGWVAATAIVAGVSRIFNRR